MNENTVREDYMGYNEEGSVDQVERFAPVYSGFDWYVIDRETQSWTKCPNQEAAIEKAEYNNFVWGETVDGQERFGNE